MKKGIIRKKCLFDFCLMFELKLHGILFEVYAIILSKSYLKFDVA